MFALGFSAGLPLLLVLGTLSFRLREAGLDRTTIGYLSWVGLAYGFKWVWSPLVDRLPIPLLTRWLGRRRSWLLVSQFAIHGGAGGHGAGRPARRPEPGGVVCAGGGVCLGHAATLRWTPSASNRPTPPTRARWPPPTRRGYRLAMIWAGGGGCCGWRRGPKGSACRHLGRSPRLARCTRTRPGRRPSW